MLCGLQVVTAGMYKVQILYTSKAQAQFRLSVGTYKDIQDGRAPALQARLPEAVSACLTHMLAKLHKQIDTLKPGRLC